MRQKDSQTGAVGGRWRTDGGLVWGAGSLKKRKNRRQESINIIRATGQSDFFFTDVSSTNPLVCAIYVSEVRFA